MARLEQGENFREAPVVDVNGNTVNPDNASVPPPNPPKFGPKQLAIAAGVLVVIGIVAFIFLSKGNDTPTDPDENVMATQEAVDDFDPFGDMSEDNEPSEDEFFSDFDTSSSALSGDLITDPSAYSIYSNDEIASLRGYGYTGDEIEYNSQQGTAYDVLVDQAIERMNEANAEWRSTVLDDASDGYKNLMANTYLDGKQTLSSCTDSDVYSVGTKRENVDYTKCGVYNYQAWIKVQTKYGAMVMMIDLPRYSQLADSGNIVVEYRYAATADNKLLYIMELKEVSIN